MIEFFMLIVGLFFLVKLSSITIDNAIKFSRLTGIGEMTVGFILIAVSTSLPELSIAIVSSAENQGLLSFGNLIGSSVSDLTLVFGIISFMGFRIKKRGFIEVDEAVIFTIVACFSLLALGYATMEVGLFLVVMFYVFSKIVIKDDMTPKSGRRHEIKTIEAVKSAFYVIVPVFFVVVAARVVTDSAVTIANNLGIARSIIGATILGAGTTLPELSVNIQAIRKGNVALALGDSVGSIVTNMTLIMGIAALISPLYLSSLHRIMLLMVIAASLIFLLMAARMRFGKVEGFVLLLLYMVYLAVLVLLAQSDIPALFGFFGIA